MPRKPQRGQPAASKLRLPGVSLRQLEPTDDVLHPLKYMGRAPAAVQALLLELFVLQSAASLTAGLDVVLFHVLLEQTYVVLAAHAIANCVHVTKLGLRQ